MLVLREQAVQMCGVGASHDSIRRTALLLIQISQDMHVSFK